MERKFLDAELRNVSELEVMYRECAELVAPANLDENPVPLARAYMTALRGIERCVELKLKLAREAGNVHEPEPEEQMVTIDLSKLSDEALHEVEMALTPEKIPDIGEKDGNDLSKVCKKQKKKKTMSHLTKTTTIQPKSEKSEVEPKTKTERDEKPET